MRCVLAVSGRPTQVVDATPAHDKDFCNHCGDCLHCYTETVCEHGYPHMWIVESHERADAILASLLKRGAP